MFDTLETEAAPSHVRPIDPHPEIAARAAAPSTRVVDGRFRGFEGRGFDGTVNGGYASGLIATALGGVSEAEVTLFKPIPIGTELRIERSPDGAEIWHDGVKRAAGHPASLELEVPAFVPLDEAVRAAERFAFRHEHPAPGCYVCGTGNAHGLRIFTGAHDSRRVVAAPFTFAPTLADASGTIPREHVWAALDCPSWFGYYAFSADRTHGVLGRLHAATYDAPRAEEPLVAIGWSLAVEGRKVTVGSAVYRATGELLGKARATWILFRPAARRDDRTLAP